MIKFNSVRLALGMKTMILYMISLIMVLVIYNVHMSSNVDSMLNEHNNVISNGFLTSQIIYHKELPPFARRPLTTFLIESVANIFKITPGKAFILINFACLYISGVLLTLLSLKLYRNFRSVLLTILVYFSSFSILFAFFPPIFTYDEPLQYCFIFGSFIAFLEKRWMLFALFFFMAMVARESTVFLLPGIYLLFPVVEKYISKAVGISNSKKFIILSMPLVMYLVFIISFIESNQLWIAFGEELTDRFSCLYANFKNEKFTIETITSFFLTIGPFLYFLKVYFTTSSPGPSEKQFIKAFWLCLIINTPIVVAATFAREARLFVLPLFFLWPFAGCFLSSELKLLSTYNYVHSVLRNLKYLAIFIFLNWINYLISFEVYSPSFGVQEDNYFNEYLFVLIFIMITHFLLRSFMRLTQTMKKTTTPKNILD